MQEIHSYLLSHPQWPPLHAQKTAKNLQDPWPNWPRESGNQPLRPRVLSTDAPSLIHPGTHALLAPAENSPKKASPPPPEEACSTEEPPTEGFPPPGALSPPSAPEQTGVGPAATSPAWAFNGGGGPFPPPSLGAPACLPACLRGGPARRGPRRGRFNEGGSRPRAAGGDLGRGPGKKTTPLLRRLPGARPPDGAAFLPEGSAAPGRWPQASLHGPRLPPGRCRAGSKQPPGRIATLRPAVRGARGGRSPGTGAPADQPRCQPRGRPGRKGGALPGGRAADGRPFLSLCPAARRCGAMAPFLLLLPALLLAGPARGNEGGGAGSCRCEKHASRPPLLARFARRLRTCDACGDLARFSFPVKNVCGLKEADWVIDFKRAHCPKGGQERGAVGADASRGPRLPAPTSQMRLAAQTAPSAAPAKSLEAPHTADPPTEGAQEPGMARSTPRPVAGGVARAADPSPVEVERAAPAPGLDARAPVISVLCLALASMGVAVLVLCQRRRWRKKARRHWALQILPGEPDLQIDSG